MESDTQQSRCSLAHKCCAKWAQDGGLSRCGNILTVTCRVSPNVTEEFWRQNLSFVFKDIPFKLCGRSYEDMLGWNPCGLENVWVSVLEFTDSKAPCKAMDVLSLLQKRCGRFDPILGLEDMDEDMREDMLQVIREMKRHRLYCVRILMEDVCLGGADGNLEKGCSFGDSELLDIVNGEVDWYSEYRRRVS